MPPNNGTVFAGLRRKKRGKKKEEKDELHLH